MCLETNALLAYLAQAADDSHIIRQAADVCHLPLPVSLVAGCRLVRASSKGGPIEMKVPVRDFIARSGYRPVRWDLWSVELATKSDITQSTKAYRMEPPAVKGYERSHAEQAW